MFFLQMGGKKPRILASTLMVVPKERLCTTRLGHIEPGRKKSGFSANDS